MDRIEPTPENTAASITLDTVFDTLPEKYKQLEAKSQQLKAKWHAPES